jgi:hypothetical protein
MHLYTRSVVVYHVLSLMMMYLIISLFLNSMINILSETSAAVNFERQRKKSNNDDNRREGEPDKVFG